MELDQDELQVYEWLITSMADARIHLPSDTLQFARLARELALSRALENFLSENGYTYETVTQHGMVTKTRVETTMLGPARQRAERLIVALSLHTKFRVDTQRHIEKLTKTTRRDRASLNASRWTD
jgi:enoyl-CoA hydratase/carnithine racemase